jgi:glycosyltransferase involved in cell wall biosynthesis
MTGVHERHVTRHARDTAVIERSRHAGIVRCMGTSMTDDELVVERIRQVSRPLRIAVVTETWPPEVNGVATSLSRVVGGLGARGHEVQLVRPRQPAVDVVAAASGFDEVLTRSLPVPRHPGLRFGVPARRRLVRLWSLQRPDVVHLATEGPLGWSALRVARHLKLPVSSDFRTNFHTYADHYGAGWLRAPVAAYLRRFHNLADATMVPTESLRRELEATGVLRLTVVGRGVDRALFDPARRDPGLRARWGAAPDDLVVAAVGRLAPEKNLDTVGLAFAAVRAVVPRARLLVVGDGPLAGRLRTEWPDAIFAGARRGTDLAAHYASADLFLFASLTETFGNVTTEAMASGLPVIAYDYAAAASVIEHGCDGLRIPFGDRAGFVASAVHLATDPALRRRLGERARVASANFGWDAIVTRVESLLRGVCANAEAALEARDPHASPARP